MFRHIFTAMATCALLASQPASAQEELPVIGIAKPWQLNFQEAVTPVMQHLTDMHDGLLVLITAISVLVLLLLAYVCLRFNEKANPVPSKTSHNTLIEIIWTAIPALILVIISIPTLRTLYYMDKTEEADMTLKIVGNAWYWSYEYPDHGVDFASNMIPDEDLKPGQPRLLSVDEPVVVPVDSTVRVLITSSDWNHNWAVPSFGIKMDAVPGKLNETWFRATKIGTYYGQCSELCGQYHGFMPIRVDVVSKERFAQWVAEKGGQMPEVANAATTTAQPPAAAPTQESPAKVVEPALDAPTATETPANTPVDAQPTADEPATTL